MSIETWLVPFAVGALLGWVTVSRGMRGLGLLLGFVFAGVLGALVGAWVLGWLGIGLTGPGGLLLRSVLGAMAFIIPLYWLLHRKK